jgi:hypothetical protein
MIFIVIVHALMVCKQTARLVDDGLQEITIYTTWVRFEGTIESKPGYADGQKRMVPGSQFQK